MKIKHGTCRIVILTKKYAYKIPLGFKGIRANKVEYVNSIKRKGFVANTEKHWWGLKQERLVNIVCYPLNITESELSSEHKHLFKLRLHNRIQIGQDSHGVWKFYDYEDTKFYRNKNL